MWIVCVDPVNIMISESSCRVTADKSKITEVKRQLSLIYPNMQLCVFALVGRSVPKITVEFANYIINDKGEVLPE